VASDNALFVSKYQLELPSKELLRQQIEKRAVMTNQSANRYKKIVYEEVQYDLSSHRPRSDSFRPSIAPYAQTRNAPRMPHPRMLSWRTLTSSGVETRTAE
jgi:hypothetical protein